MSTDRFAGKLRNKVAQTMAFNWLAAALARTAGTTIGVATEQK